LQLDTCNTIAVPGGGDEMEAIQNNPADVLEREEVNQLLGRAQAGDLTALPQLQAFLDSRPEIWKRAGDLAGHVREALLTLASGQSLLAREALSRRMNQLEEDLAGPSPSPLEQLLVQRVVLTWAQAHLGDLDVLQAQLNGSPQGPHLQRRQDSSHRRYLTAIKALATVRKLLKPGLSPVELALRPVPETSPSMREPRACRLSAVPVLN
jgi:hypothetical protein